MSEAPPAILAEDVEKSFEEGRLQALRGASLRVEPGEFVALMGPSGCGKSTLLHILGTLETPDAGRIEIAGEPIDAVKDIDTFRAERLGFVFQLHNLIPSLTALENVAVPMLGAVPLREDVWGHARALLESVGLGPRADALPTVLSGGERQRVALARAFANDPRIILADEPTGSLDSTSGQQVLEQLESIRLEKGTTLLVVTHDPRVSARADRVVHMLDGRIQVKAED